MKKRLLYLMILVLPFLIMVTVNEFVRLRTVENGFQKQGITAINSANADQNKCTWHCHNNTNFCKSNHVKLLNNYFAYTDLMYFGVINSLKKTGDYVLANILFLVVLIPALLYFLLIQSIKMQFEINKIKQENG